MTARPLPASPNLDQLKRQAKELRRRLEVAGILLDAGADIAARDEFASTALAWAARANAVQMAEFLLARGAPVNPPDGEPCATPLMWAERRGNAEVAAILRRHGA